MRLVGIEKLLLVKEYKEEKMKLDYILEINIVYKYV